VPLDGAAGPGQKVAAVGVLLLFGALPALTVVAGVAVLVFCGQFRLPALPPVWKEDTAGPDVQARNSWRAQLEQGSSTSRCLVYVLACAGKTRWQGSAAEICNLCILPASNCYHQGHASWVVCCSHADGLCWS
jgi:hypothetical protein